MTTTAKTLRTALWDEPIAIAIDQPHQILLSTGSVALMAGFASSVNIVHPLVGLVIAIGIEWAWLRGVASDASKPTPWGTALNVSAFALAAVWGVLLVAKLLHAYDPETWGWWMAVIHVVPLIWLSLCSAMCHRSKLIAEAAARLAVEAEAAARERRRLADEAALEKQRRETEIALQAEIARKDAELARWMRSQEFQAAQKATAANQPARVAQPFTPGSVGCKHCNRPVEFQTPSEKGVIVRLGCPACRAERKANR